ncbi:PRC-barrel domain-containing protein [Chroogloeocystis siderophila]|uniref:Photosystem reaction center subunit H n=1 Tax=Chroogloeocystis siderophila 5.2 s.c.1 TaxID=247279 RepID=A0A1U7HGF7_9CHRO|nr:PRC-barrel domain-containing protein [Chroogloeocystis siderophila]OKH22682.1 photosystem reaction center subunit H [Chroogloeocystis siderophila 5.2 s.c.1]
MINVVRRSQILGLMELDSATASRFGTVKEVWIDDTGQVVYLGTSEGYTPLEQVSVIGPDAVLTYSHTVLPQTTLNLRRLYRLPVRSSMTDSLGWVEDFLFDWETGNIAAFILSGDIAAPFGGRAVLYPEDVVIEAEAVVLREGAQERLKSEPEGLKGFLSEKSQQVKNLVKTIAYRLQSLVSPHDKPEVVRVKIKEVHDELAASGQHDKNALQQATEFLQNEWESFQQSLNRASERVKRALDSAWNLTGKKS